MFTFIAGATITGGRKQHRRQKIVGQSVRHLRQHMRGRRRNHHCIRRLRLRNVLNLALVIQSGSRLRRQH
jgi:hypothetical protein